MGNENYMAHWGIKGMRWGVRRSQAQLARARGSSKNKKNEPEHEDYKKAHSSKSVKSMSNQELRDRNNRLQAEKTYASLTAKKSKGERAVKAYIAGAGLITAVAGATVVYAKYGGKTMNAVRTVSDLAKGKIWLY